MSTMSVNAELELKIGHRAGLGDFDPTKLARPLTADQRMWVRSWIIAQGVDANAVNRMQEDSLVKCYNIPSYLRTCRLNNPTKRAGHGRDFSSSIFEPEPEPETVPEVKVEYTPPPTDQKLSVNAADIARAADVVLSARIEQAKRALEATIDTKIKNTKLELSDAAKEQLKQMARDAAVATMRELMPPRQLEIKNTTTGEIKNIGVQHYKFDVLLRAAGIRLHDGFRPNLWLTGPTGSGKTTACKIVAKVLGIPFGGDSSLDADFKVMGYMDSNGKYVETEFYRRFTQGGLYVMDEVDVWFPSAILAMNAPLANGWCSFPCGMRDRHPDFMVAACANTWGHGATNAYVGRTKLDAATLDRFGVKIDWPIDEALEHAIAASIGGEVWCKRVQGFRQKVREQGIQVIISPRATFNGIALLAQGFAERDVIDMTFASALKDEHKVQLGLIDPSLERSKPPETKDGTFGRRWS